MKLPAFIPAAAVCPASLAVVLLAASCASTPKTGGDSPAEILPMAIPSTPAPTTAGHLVDIRAVDPTITVGLRYATADNFTGKPLYPAGMPCLVNESTARRLVQAQAYLRKRGYGLKIWDAYRPPEVQRKLFAASPDGEWVAEPDTSWSHHNFGTAVDVTLVDRQGREQIMPSDFDEFNGRAAHIYHAGNSLVDRNLVLLQRAMADAGFHAATGEWWHFYDIWSRTARLTHASEAGIILPD